MPTTTAKTLAGTALCLAVFGLLVAIPALVVSSIAEAQNAKDDDGDVTYSKVKLVGHLDVTRNETFTAWIWEDSSGVVNVQSADWNGTCVSGSGAELTTNFTIPSRYLPNTNTTTVETCVSPRQTIETIAETHRSVGRVCVSPTGKLTFNRDITNSTASWSFTTVSCEIPSFSFFYLPYKVTFD
jgi:hypothetical protein